MREINALKGNMSKKLSAEYRFLVATTTSVLDGTTKELPHREIFHKRFFLSGVGILFEYRRARMSPIRQEIITKGSSVTIRLALRLRDRLLKVSLKNPLNLKTAVEHDKDLQRPG